MKRFLTVLLLLLAGCAPGRRVEIVRIYDLHTEHLDRMDVRACIRNGGAKAVTLYEADVTVVYRDRDMCRVVLDTPVTLPSRSESDISVQAGMEVYDLAVVSAFSRMLARDSVKALSFTALKGTVCVGEGARRRKIRLR